MPGQSPVVPRQPIRFLDTPLWYLGGQSDAGTRPSGANKAPPHEAERGGVLKPDALMPAEHCCAKRRRALHMIVI